jgi:hypothetical protein
MSWCYEIRGAEDRLVEVRSGFATEDKAVKAGGRAKQMIGSICDFSPDVLTLVTKEDQPTLAGDSMMSSAPEAAANVNGAAKQGWNLTYPWQQAVLDAFLELHPKDLPGRINVAERAISSRLLEADPFELGERIALGEALLALRRLLREQSHAEQECNEKKGTA